MILLLVAYLGGVLTIVSPCILPVLPFVFARADQPFLRNGLPMLAGMAVAFAAVATLAAVVGGWAVAANEYGRVAALALLALFGAALVFPTLAAWFARPVVALGARLPQERARPSIFGSAVLGVATGMLWAPCAGPVLGLVLTGAALSGASWQTSALLLAYALGAATSLGAVVLAGGRIVRVLKRSLGVGEWVRRALGIAVLTGVAAIALGLDTGVLTRLSAPGTAALEQRLLDRLGPAPESGPAMAMSGGPAMMNPNPAMTMQPRPAAGSQARLPVEGALPALSGTVDWLNSPPLTPEALRGKVVLIDFWTYSCINCLRAIPHVRAWAERYRDDGLVVIGVHTPEFAFERSLANVRRAVADLRIGYPVAVDSDYAIWRAFSNRYWPAHYFIDAQGRIRHHKFGEGDYEASERAIRDLLAEAGRTVAPALARVKARGAEMESDAADVRSPETYIGYERAENFVSPGGFAEEHAKVYAPGAPRLNEWGLMGTWTVGAESARLESAGGVIAYRFHARDLHLVLGPGPDGRPVRFRVTLDGAPPGDSHGVDADAEGNGVVTGQRLYQLLRQGGAIGDRTFEIRFLDPGVQAYAFTFG